MESSSLSFCNFPEPAGISLTTCSDGSLFNLAKLRAKTKVRRVLIRELVYADDAVFFAHSQQELQSLCDAFAVSCSDFGVTISISKTKVMSFGLDVVPLIQVNGSTLENVDQFCYLGTTVSSSVSFIKSITLCSPWTELRVLLQFIKIFKLYIFQD